MGALLDDGAKVARDRYWTNSVGLVTIAANVPQNHNSDNAETKKTAGIRREFCQYVFQMCEKMFGILLSGACANVQMSPDQFADATSRIEERIQKPLLLVDGLRAELEAFYTLLGFAAFLHGSPDPRI